MSRKERDRLKVVVAGRLKQVEAARLLRLSVCQARRVVARYRAEGDAGRVHRGRGRRSNRRIDEATVRRTLGLVKTRYRDFGPTLAAETLAACDGIEGGPVPGLAPGWRWPPPGPPPRKRPVPSGGRPDIPTLR